MAEKRKATKWQKLMGVKGKLCAGSATKAQFEKAATAYVNDAVKKGNKTEAEAQKSVNRLQKAKCATGTGTGSSRKGSSSKGRTRTPAKSIKVDGKNFKQVSCHTSERAATRAKKKIQESGRRVRVTTNTAGTSCVYQGPMRKKVALRSGQTLAGTKRNRSKK